MASGDPVQGFNYRQTSRTLKTTTGCTKGYVLAYDTDGFAHATQALRTAAPTYAIVVAFETVVAPVSGQSTAKVVEDGVIEIEKVSGALVKGQLIGLSTTAGKVGAWVAPDAPTAFAEAALQAELDKLLYVVGTCHEDAATGDTSVNVKLGGVR
jgi:hypothetical protein